MSEYTALDKVVLFHDQNCTFGACAGHEARAELAALRSSVAELEQRRTFDAGVIDGLNVAIKIKDERMAELEAAQAVLTPRPCVTCKSAAEKMREAAAKLGDNKATSAANDIRSNPLTAFVLQSYADDIRALPLPTCGDCNPLSPSKTVDECPVCGCENGQHAAVCMFK